MPEWIMPILSLAGTLVGSVSGILVSQRLVAYRLEQLEKKVDKHNDLVERMAKVEASVEAAHKRLDDAGAKHL